MMRARHRADGDARTVSRIDGWPPYLLVVDVGHIIEVSATFRAGGKDIRNSPMATATAPPWVTCAIRLCCTNRPRGLLS
jgi:hypothetical protein